MMKQLICTFTFVIVSAWAQAQAPAFHVTQQGEGFPVLLLPGFATPGSVWDETVAHLPDGYSYYQVSYAGFNGLAPIDTPWYETIKRELIAYVVDHDLRELRLIGHSLGGNLATEIAADLPDRVAQLVIVDALACMREVMMPGVSAEQLAYDSPPSQQMLQASDETMRQTARMTAQSMTQAPDKVDSLEHWIMQADRKTYVYGYVDLLKQDLRPKLSQITAPTLILGAPFPNTEAVKSTLEQQYADLENKTIRVAPDSRHFIMFDQPEWFYEQINAAFTPYE